jgi:hypothetical protein
LFKHPNEIVKINRIASVKIIAFPVFALGIITLLNACSTTPHRIDKFTYQETGQMSYLWTSGLDHYGIDFDLYDYAFIVKIDGFNIPLDYLPSEGSAPIGLYLFEIPAGKHVIEIIYKEETTGSILMAPMTFPLSFPSVKKRSQKSLTLFTEPNRTYAPFADDQCSQAWFWVEDRGPYVAGSAGFRLIISDRTKPVVAGERPDKDSCK